MSSKDVFDFRSAIKLLTREVAPESPELPLFAIQTSLPGSRNGRERISSVFRTLKIAVFDPIPTPKIRIAITAKEASRRKVRKVYRRSLPIELILRIPLPVCTNSKER